MGVCAENFCLMTIIYILTRKLKGSLINSAKLAVSFLNQKESSCQECS